MITTVTNLNTLDERTYTLPPRQAVIAAYAQAERKDYNTWDYETKYAHLVTHGKHTVACCDWCAINKE